MDELLKKIDLIKRQKIVFYGVAALSLLYVLYVFFHLPPQDFPLGQVITVESGESLQSITTSLYDAHVIKSPFVFRTTVILLGGEKRVIAGDYLLDKKEGPADLAYRLVNGKFHLAVAKVTIPEGWNIFQISDYLKKNLINFDTKHFLALAKNKEGYLFPDTYFISESAKPESVIDRMNKNFTAKISSLNLATSTHSLKDIIIVASIVEAEARTTESRKIIAGIIWKRIALGMPLQVDSTFSYINGKNTYDLTANDLIINSPYNTYVYKGLPPGPIDNPGIDAINSTINPTATKYLYFLSSKSGKMYYATTFEQHLKNKELYLNQ